MAISRSNVMSILRGHGIALGLPFLTVATGLLVSVAGKAATFAPSEVIDQTVVAPFHVQAADIDGDLDLDLVVGSAVLSWYENVDGLGSYDLVHLIGTPSDMTALVTGDVDGDGDPDIVFESDATYWTENLGDGSFGAPISIEPEEADVLALADIDRDGDLDLLTGGDGIGEAEGLFWLTNDGTGNFGVREEISDIEARVLAVADMDGDNDLDVIVGWFSTVAWHENFDGNGQFGSRQTIHSDPEFTPISDVQAGDFDGDGDIDVVTAWADLFAPFDKAKWHNNLDGDGDSFVTEEIASEQFNGRTTAVRPVR